MIQKIKFDDKPQRRLYENNLVILIASLYFFKCPSLLLPALIKCFLGSNTLFFRDKDISGKVFAPCLYIKTKIFYLNKVMSILTARLLRPTIKLEVLLGVD